MKEIPNRASILTGDTMSEENIKYEYQGIGLGKSEKYVGKKKFDEYCAIYHITAYSDLQLLEELIFREILQEQFKIQIEDKKSATIKKNKNLKEDDQKEIAIPTYVVDAMNKNLEQVLSLKEKLGLINANTGDDAFKHFKILENKFKLWCEENQGSRTFTCEHCSKTNILYIKPDVWESQGHKFFKDRILCNEHLIKLYKEKKITSGDVSSVLGTSPAYTEWLIKKWYQNEKL